MLELACGSGRVTFTLAAALPKAEIVGVDSSIEMLSDAAAAWDAAESPVRQRVSSISTSMPHPGAEAKRPNPNAYDHAPSPELELLFVAAGFEIAQQYGDCRFVPRDRTSQYVVTVARRPRDSARPFRWRP